MNFISEMERISYQSDPAKSFADLVKNNLRRAIKKAERSVSAASDFNQPVDRDLPFGWSRIPLTNIVDLKVLSDLYFESIDRDIDELVLISIRGCFASTDLGKRLFDEFSQVLDCEDSDSIFALLRVLEKSLDCIYQIGIWTGRLDFCCKGAPIFFHREKVRKNNRQKGLKSNEKQNIYKKELLLLVFKCLDESLQAPYNTWEDIVYKNADLFEKLNKDMAASLGSGFQKVDCLNIPDKIKTWAKSDPSVREKLDTLKERFERVKKDQLKTQSRKARPKD